jgi:hypothetical protein
VLVQAINACKACSAQLTKLIHRTVELSTKKSMKTVLFHDYGGRALILLKKIFAKTYPQPVLFAMANHR